MHQGIALKGCQRDDASIDPARSSAARCSCWLEAQGRNESLFDYFGRANNRRVLLIRIRYVDRVSSAVVFRRHGAFVDSCQFIPCPFRKFHPAQIRIVRQNHRWKSRNRARRPKIDRGLRDLIRRMSRENALWGASRIHGALLMLGFEVAQSTVSEKWQENECSFGCTALSAASRYNNGR
jgi:hypothetical protein